jgi:hypothetical protein
MFNLFNAKKLGSNNSRRGRRGKRNDAQSKLGKAHLRVEQLETRIVPSGLIGDKNVVPDYAAPTKATDPSLTQTPPHQLPPMDNAGGLSGLPGQGQGQGQGTDPSKIAVSGAPLPGSDYLAATPPGRGPKMIPEKSSTGNQAANAGQLTAYTQQVGFGTTGQVPISGQPSKEHKIDQGKNVPDDGGLIQVNKDGSFTSLEDPGKPDPNSAKVSIGVSAQPIPVHNGGPGPGDSVGAAGSGDQHPADQPGQHDGPPKPNPSLFSPLPGGQGVGFAPVKGMHGINPLLGPGPLTSITFGNNFEGIDFQHQPCSCLPPDNALAVGDGYVMHAVNASQIRVYDENGNILLDENMDTFFGLGQGNGGDPFIVYDDIANRWYVEQLNASYTGVEIAVSKDANPLDGFYTGFINIGFLDFPKIGFNYNEMVITGDQIFGSYAVGIYSFPKSSLLSGSFSYNLYTIPGYPNNWLGLMPAKMHNATASDPMYFIDTAGYLTGGTQNGIRVWTGNNLQGASGSLTSVDFTVDTYGLPPFADQPGASGSINTNAAGMISADWRRVGGVGHILGTQNATLSSDGFSTTHAIVYEVDTDTMTLDQQINISPGSGVFTYMPAAALDASGDIGITYMESSNSEFLSMYVAAHGVGDAAGTYVAALARTDNSFFTDSGRTGDYSTVVVDPSSPNTFWASSEYSPVNSGSNIWATYITSFYTVLSVTTTNPVVGSVIATTPTDFTINWSDALDPSTVDAADLTVNGMTPNSVTLSNGNLTTDFFFNTSPVTTEGLQTMSIPANEVLRISDETGNTAFNGTFRYDPNPMYVTSTTPSAGAVDNLSGSSTDLFVYLSEQFDASTVNTSNISVSMGTVSAATVVSNSGGVYEIDYTISGLTSEGTENYSLAYGAINDADGNPVQAYSSNFILNIVTSPYPTPLKGKAPAGSLVYDPGVSAGIQFVGDTDSFTINLNAGQTATIDLTTDPSLQGQIDLYDPSNNNIGEVIASAAGAEAVLQTVQITTAGTYTITISGANSTTGNFTATLYLNSALENDEHGLGSNDTLGTAQSLDSAMIGLGYGASRAAVLGATHNPPAANNDVFIVDRAAGKVDHLDSNGNIIASWAIDNNGSIFGSAGDEGLELGPNNDLYVGVATNFGQGRLDHYTDAGVELGTVPLPNDAGGFFYYPWGFDVTANGDIWVPQTNSGNILHLDSSGNVLETYPTTVYDPQSLAIGPDGNIYVSYPYPNYAVGLVYNGDLSGNVYYFAYGGSTLGLKWSPDNTLWVGDSFGAMYHYDLSGNNLGNVYPNAEVITPQADLSGNVWESNYYDFNTGTGSAEKFDSSGNFLTRDTFNCCGVIGLSVVGSDMPLQAVNTNSTDFYSVTLNAGDSLSAVAKGIPGGTLELLDGGGNLLAIGATGFSRADQYVKSFVNTSGMTETFYLEVINYSPGDVSYDLVVTKNADFEVGGNSQQANAYQLDGTGTVLGALQKSGALYSQIWEYNLPLPLHQTDATTGAFLSTSEINAGIVSNPFGENLAYDGTHIWYNDGGYFGDNRIYEIDPATGNVLSSILPNEPYYLFGIAWLNGDLWGTDFINLYEIDPGTGNILQQFNNVFNGYTLGLAADPTNDVLYAVSQFDFNTGQSELYRVDPNTGTILAEAHDNPTSYEQDLAFAGGKLYVSETYSPGFLNGISVYDASTLAFIQHIDTTGQLNGNEMMAGLGGDGLGGVDQNWFKFNANAGDNLVITGSAFNSNENGNTGEFQNSLSPVVNLYDGNGNLLGSATDSGNGTATFTFAAGYTGTYYVEIQPQNGTVGEYVLNVSGNTGTPDPFTVTSTNPANGTYLISLSQMTVTFNESVLIPS